MLEFISVIVACFVLYISWRSEVKSSEPKARVFNRAFFYCPYIPLIVMDLFGKMWFNSKSEIYDPYRNIHIAKKVTADWNTMTDYSYSK